MAVPGTPVEYREYDGDKPILLPNPTAPDIGDRCYWYMIGETRLRELLMRARGGDLPDEILMELYMSSPRTDLDVDEAELEVEDEVGGVEFVMDDEEDEGAA